jgi:hypothetical protein
MPEETTQAIKLTAKSDNPNRALWHSHLIWTLLAGSLAAALLLLGVIVWTTSDLRESITGPFDIHKFLDLSSSSQRLLHLPLAGIFIWLLNTSIGVSLYRQGDRRVAAYLLWATTIIVQLALWPLTLRL